MPSDKPDESAHLSPQEMREWLSQEVKDATKALELRLKEATDFVTAYALGEISAAKAAESHWKYDQRWGEALLGATAAKGATDEQILAAIDRAHGKYESLKGVSSRYEKLFRTKNTEGPTR